MAQLKTFLGVLPHSQGQNPAMTVLYVPSSLDSGHLPSMRLLRRYCLNRLLLNHVILIHKLLNHLLLNHLMLKHVTVNHLPLDQVLPEPRAQVIILGAPGPLGGRPVSSRVPQAGPKPYALNPYLQFQTLIPKLYNLNPKPSTLNPRPTTLNPEP